MSELHGFELIKEQTVPEIDTRARLFRHVRTGAELLSLENQDENKSFGVAFKTPPPDDTGLPHILEHTVLTGSRKYPTKDPFVQLLKTSLKTFLNAMTFPDMTVYPVASTNMQDFYNLVDVYLDAVFYPLITPEKLKQEGWHYENEKIDDPDSRLIYKGVVFNEMKSVYQTPDSLMRYAISKSLMPDTPYALSSGGDPAAIPQLTFEQFKQFHETYYHPSNARIVFYGDDDPEERLRRIDAFITEFERIPVDAELPLQERFENPVRIVERYDAGEEAEENKSMVTVNWLLPEITDRETVMALSILSYILTDTPASPLRRALIESGLGEDLTGGGFDTYKRQSSFSVGLKGIKEADADTVETLILETLSELADNGVDEATVEAALNTFEFQLRERNTGRFPRGILTMIQVLPAWMHGGDPLERLAFEEPLNSIKQKAESGEFFEGLIGEHLLNNSHRTTVLLKPDADYGKERDADERDRLERFAGGLSAEDRVRIMEEAVSLKEAQETPDSPEDIAKIPSLTLDDIERDVKVIPREELDINGTTVLYHEQPTSGIVYLNVGLNMRTVPVELLPYVELFGRALTEIGTETQDYVQLSQRIGAKTGGISAGSTTGMTLDHSSYYAYLMVNAKSMHDQTEDMMAILRDILLTIKLDNKDRFKQMVLEAKAGMEARAPIAGMMYAASRIRSAFNEVSYADEIMGGVSQLVFLRELAKRVDNDWSGVLADLEKLRSLLVNRANLLVNVTTDADNWAAFRPQLEAFIVDLPQVAADTEIWAVREAPDYEALTIPGQVNFVAKAINLYDLGYELSGSQQVILKHMNLDYMWTKIRVQGGAYGGRALFDYVDGLMTFLSWRDPNLVGTLNVYDQAGDYLKSVQLTQDDLEKAIIGAIGDMDAYLLPDAKGRVSMNRYLTGITDEFRQQYRDEVLNTSLEDFHKLGEILSQIAGQGKAAAVCSPEKATDAANQGVDFTITKLL